MGQKNCFVSTKYKNNCQILGQKVYFESTQYKSNYQILLTCGTSKTKGCERETSKIRK